MSDESSDGAGGSNIPSDAKEPPKSEGDPQINATSGKDPDKTSAPKAVPRHLADIIKANNNANRLRTLRAYIEAGQSAVVSENADRVFRKALQASQGFEATTKLKAEINELNARIEREIKAEQTTRRESERLARDLELLQQKEELAFLLSRVSTLAHESLLSDHKIKEQFLSSAECPTFVISMDIRRSTELMLKARKPELFAKFMTSVSDGLEDIIKRNFGVVDKFTGDGVLAFFPDFFTGPDAAYFAILTAAEAHKLFSTRYREHRQSFSTILSDVGLGIGIDYGNVSLMHVAGGLTVVGAPVVYACRMGSAPAGKTYLNQPAYEMLADKYSASCFITEAELEIKHEGKVLAYDIALTNKPFAARQPPWLEGASESVMDHRAPSGTSATVDH
jgi:class 3 adenylate cyclase